MHYINSNSVKKCTMYPLFSSVKMWEQTVKKVVKTVRNNNYSAILREAQLNTTLHSRKIKRPVKKIFQRFLCKSIKSVNHISVT